MTNWGLKELNKISFATDVETGDAIETTIEDMIKSRILWEGDSGSGKSYGMTGMIEQTQDKAQRIIIDLEGEYFTLKDNFPFLLVGKKTDVVKPNVELNLNDVYVDKLIKKLIEKSADTIIDLSETPNDATHFLKIFQIAVFKYAKLMKRPLLIFVDEAHVFAPEKGQGSEESLVAMKNLAKRGRKKGIGLICGTQAIADFSKDVVRQLRTRFIGNCTYENDIKAAAHTLGFPKSREPEFKELGEEHHFFASTNGSYITINGKRPKTILKIKANKNKTKLHDFSFNKTITFKEKDAKIIQNIASDFSDIPQEIDEELTAKERLQQENIENKKTIQEQRIKISQLERQQPRQDPEAIEKAYQRGIKVGGKESEEIINILRKNIESIKKNAAKVKQTILELQSKTDRDFDFILQTTPNIEEQIEKLVGRIPSVPIIPETIDTLVDTVLNKCAQTCLKKLAEFNKPLSRKKLAIYSGYSPKSGGYNAAVISMREGGFVTESNKVITITTLGISQAGGLHDTPTNHDDLLQHWTRKLSVCPAKLLKKLCEIHPDFISRQELAAQTGYSSGSGGFNGAVIELRDIGLVEEYNKQVKASEAMFP